MIFRNLSLTVLRDMYMYSASRVADVAQLVERQIVALDAVGSIPIVRPTYMPHAARDQPISPGFFHATASILLVSQPIEKVETHRLRKKYSDRETREKIKIDASPVCAGY